MAVHIRLARYGAKKNAQYRLVVADHRCRRDGRFIEQIGVVDPHGKLEDARVDQQRLDYWKGQGAQLSTTVSRLISKLHRSSAHSSEAQSSEAQSSEAQSSEAQSSEAQSAAGEG